MNTEDILDLYKKICINLAPAENLSIKDFESIKNLERFVKEGAVKEKDIIKAFKKANKSNFLSGKVKDFKANITWLTNPVNIDKVNSGKYDDKTKKIESHDYNFNQEEIENHKKNMARLEKIRQDKKHQEWLETYWYKKYPNLKETS